MSQYSTDGRALAARLRTGEHALTNADLRRVFGISRVTVKARTEVAAELRRAGLEILSDPAAEPLVVRKEAPRPVGAPTRPYAATARPARSGPAWWRRPWVIAVAALVALFLVVGALSGGDPAPPAGTAAAAQETPEPAAVTATPTPTASPEAQTIADARTAVSEDHYHAALVIAAALGDDDERAIGRRIARRIAFRALRALRGNDRASASRLLRSARDYPHTGEVARADRALDAAQQRARDRAAARRRARATAAERRRLRVEARRRARAAARAQAEAPSAPAAPSAPSAPAPSTSGPSTVNWCGKRDGDGDGIYCEGM